MFAPHFFRLRIVSFSIILFSLNVFGQGALKKVTVVDDNKFTSAGQIALTITNFGTIGTANAFFPTQPSCEYPYGSGIEHIYQGGLWVGAQVKTQDSTSQRNGQYYVSTATSDRATSSSNSSLINGFEFNAEANDSIVEYSTLTANRPTNSQFKPGAISHQDFVCDYNDFHTRDPISQDSIADHTPLNIQVHQESYVWNFPFINYMVILSYTIKNASKDTLDSVYVGLWDNAIVRNTRLVPPGSPSYFNYTGQGFDSTQRLAYSFDYNGVPGGSPANSYIGLKLLGSTPFPSGVDSIGNLLRHTYYNAWLYKTNNPNFGSLVSPGADFDENYLNSRYSRMTQSGNPADIASLRTTPQDVSYLLSTGPWSRLLPDSSINVVFVVSCAKKNGNAPAGNDLPSQRANLYSGLAWAQRIYNGEDVNGNDILDPGEDIATRDSLGLRYLPDNKITRYLLPTPPRQPIVRADIQSQHVTLYWDKITAEESIDPITGVKDFEGYRIYRSNNGADFLTPESFTINIPLVAQFDLIDSTGFNTGFDKVLLPSPKMFPKDTVKYWYRFPPSGVQSTELNGWQYLYGVSAFSKGDSANNIPSLESALSIARVIPGTPPTSSPSATIGVYPNPYYVNAYWDGSSERQRKVYFYNLPARCKITIFTLAGDIIQVIDHDASTYNGSDIQWFSQFDVPGVAPQFTGGEHAWDLITRYDQAIATGLYLFTVEDPATGIVKRGKFLVIK